MPIEQHDVGRRILTEEELSLFGELKGLAVDWGFGPLPRTSDPEEIHQVMAVQIETEIPGVGGTHVLTVRFALGYALEIATMLTMAHELASEQLTEVEATQ